MDSERTIETAVPTSSAEHSASRSRWYLIQCKPRQDARALENLGRQRFTCYQPMISVEKLRDGRRVESQEPLFPRYLFVWLDQVKDAWHSIRSTRGVSQIVRFNEYPLPVQDEIIERIRQRLADDPPRVPCLTPGERVRITDGAFSDLEAVFVASDGNERVMLLLNILHREQMLSFPLASIRRSSAS